MIRGNLIRLGRHAKTYSSNTGLDITVNNENGTVTFNGTNNSDEMYTFWIGTVSFDQDASPNYRLQFPFDTILTGAPADASFDKYYFGGVYIYQAITSNIPANTQFTIAICIKPYVVCDNVVFRPMIRPACISSDTYRPFSMKLNDLTTYSYNLSTVLRAYASSHFTVGNPFLVSYRMGCDGKMGILRFTNSEQYNDGSFLIFNR